MKIFTNEDVISGRCLPDQVGQRDSVEEDAESISGSGLEDAEFPYEHELALYRADATAYKAMHPPAVVVKLLELSERRRAEQEAIAKAKTKPIEQMSTAELVERLRGSLAEIPPALPVKLLPTLEKGLTHIVHQHVPAGEQQAAHETCDALLYWLRLIIDNSDHAG